MIIIADANPKINSWTAKKRAAVRVARHLRLASFGWPKLQKRYERMSQCGNTIAYEITSDGRYHYKGAWLCRDRLCPVCSWRLSVKRTAEMIKTLNLLAARYPKTKAIHVVLTVRNCSAEELQQTIRAITSGFTRLKKRQLWTDYIIGYVRSVEISYNKDTDMYHPHLHVVAIVPDKYTRQISIGDWVDMWRSCLHINYNPVVWANQAYTKKADMDYSFGAEDMSEEAARAAIIEACKYAVKPESITEAAEAGDIGIVAKALEGVKMVSYGGIIKTIRAELKLSNSDKPAEQLPRTVINPAEGLAPYTVMYQWCNQTRSYIRTDDSSIKIEQMF